MISNSQRLITKRRKGNHHFPLCAKITRLSHGRISSLEVPQPLMVSLSHEQKHSVFDLGAIQRRNAIGACSLLPSPHTSLDQPYKSEEPIAIFQNSVIPATKQD